MDNLPKGWIERPLGKNRQFYKTSGSLVAYKAMVYYDSWDCGWHLAFHGQEWNEVSSYSSPEAAMMAYELLHGE